MTSDRPPAGSRRAHGTRGSVSLLVVVFLPALLIAAGLVLDGGRQLQARRDAQGAAATAARAAVQLDPDETYADRLQPNLAVRRGQAELAAQGVTGNISVNGPAVTVTVTVTVDYQLLPGSRTITETATAFADQGVNAGTRSLTGG